MTKSELVVRKSNQLMASPVQILTVSLVWFIGLAVIGNAAIVLNLCAQHQFRQALECFALVLVSFQILGPQVVSTIPMFLLYKRMTTAQYGVVDRCYRQLLLIWPRLFIGSSGTFNVVKGNWALNRIWMGDHETGEKELREVVHAVEANVFTRKSYFTAVLQNNLAYAILKNGGCLEDAEVAAHQAIALIHSKGALADSAIAIFPLTNLGVIYFLQGDFVRSEESLIEALSCSPPGKLTMEVFPSHTIFTRTNALLWLTATLFKQSKDEAALARVKEVLEIVSYDSDCVTLECLDSLSRVCNELAARNHFEEAEVLLEHGYAVAANNPDFGDNTALLESYETLLSLTDRASEIPDLRRWIRPVHLLHHTI